MSTPNSASAKARRQQIKEYHISTWIKDRIGQYGFEAGADYTLVSDLSSPKSGSTKARRQQTKEYHISIDMAKELAMVERNAAPLSEDD